LSFFIFSGSKLAILKCEISLKILRNFCREKIEFWNEKMRFFVRIAHSRKACNEKSLQKMPIFCSLLPFCAIFSLIFENFARFLLPKKRPFFDPKVAL